MERIRQLYEQYYADVYRYVYSFTGDCHRTEDIVQSTFLTAIGALSSFQKRSSIKTWLIGIARNELRVYRRKNPPVISLQQLPQLETQVENTREEYLSVMEAIRSLDSARQEIVVLRLINGFSFREIAELTGRTETDCRVTFFRAKQKLLEALQ